MKQFFRVLFAGTLTVCALVAAPESRGSIIAAAQDGTEVTIAGNKFEPKKLTVAEGTTVTWINKDGTHSVRSDSDAFISKTLKENETFSYQFNRAGNYPYHCGFHGSRGGGGMSGVIVVVKKK